MTNQDPLHADGDKIAREILDTHDPFGTEPLSHDFIRPLLVEAYARGVQVEHDGWEMSPLGEDAAERYVILDEADSHAIGYERRDDTTTPRVHVIGFHEETIEPGRVWVQFHLAGEDVTHVGLVEQVAADHELVSGMDPVAALKVGVAKARADHRQTFARVPKEERP